MKNQHLKLFSYLSTSCIAFLLSSLLYHSSRSPPSTLSLSLPSLPSLISFSFFRLFSPCKISTTKMQFLCFYAFILIAREYPPLTVIYNVLICLRFLLWNRILFLSLCIYKVNGIVVVTKY